MCPVVSENNTPSSDPDSEHVVQSSALVNGFNFIVYSPLFKPVHEAAAIDSVLSCGGSVQRVTSVDHVTRGLKTIFLVPSALEAASELGRRLAIRRDHPAIVQHPGMELRSTTWLYRSKADKSLQTSDYGLHLSDAEDPPSATPTSLPGDRELTIIEPDVHPQFKEKDRQRTTVDPKHAEMFRLLSSRLESYDWSIGSKHNFVTDADTNYNGPRPISVNYFFRIYRDMLDSISPGFASSGRLAARKELQSALPGDIQQAAYIGQPTGAQTNVVDPLAVVMPVGKQGLLSEATSTSPLDIAGVHPDSAMARSVTSQDTSTATYPLVNEPSSDNARVLPSTSSLDLLSRKFTSSSMVGIRPVLLEQWIREYVASTSGLAPTQPSPSHSKDTGSAECARVVHIHRPYLNRVRTVVMGGKEYILAQEIVGRIIEEEFSPQDVLSQSDLALSVPVDSETRQQMLVVVFIKLRIQAFINPVGSSEGCKSTVFLFDYAMSEMWNHGITPEDQEYGGLEWKQVFISGHKGISAADAPLIIAYMVDRLGKDLSFVTFRNDPEHRSLPLKDGEPPILDSFRRLLQDDFSLARLVAESAGRR